MARIVMKFGGTSVADLERISIVARHVKREVDAGNQVAVVVSAMAGKTNELVGWVQNMPKAVGASSPIYDAREYDAVVASGEQVTSGLLAIALQSMGIDARSWHGWQIPIRTDNAHGAARIQNIDGEEIIRRMEMGQVAVVAGFQGIGPDHRIATLGRGGSDTSAVAVAAAEDFLRGNAGNGIAWRQGSAGTLSRTCHGAQGSHLRAFKLYGPRCSGHGRSDQPARNPYLRRG